MFAFAPLLSQVASMLSLVILLVAGIGGVVRFRLLPLGLRYLAGLIWFGMGVELASYLLRLRHLPNLLLIPLDTAGELWLLSLVYGWALQSAIFTRVRPWLAGAFVLYAAISTLLSPEPARFKPALLVLECILLLAMAGLYLRKLLNELRVQHLTHDSVFWVSAGLLLYAFGKLQIALFSDYLLQHYSRELNILVWDIHALLLTVLYFCYCMALWMRPQK